MRNILWKKKSGNILLVALLALFAVSIVGLSLTKSASDVKTIETNMDATVRIYDDIAIEQVITYSFYEDVAGFTAAYNTPFGVMKDYTWQAYTNIVEQIENTKFTEMSDGVKVYNENSIEVIAENSGIRSNSSGKLKERMKVLAARIESYKITLITGFSIDEGSEKNLLLFDSGDTYALQDLVFTVDLQDGASRISQTYCITGLKITYVGTTNGIRGSILDEDAELVLISQDVT